MGGKLNTAGRCEEDRAEKQQGYRPNAFLKSVRHCQELTFWSARHYTDEKLTV
jgi:hypothetical protein